MRLSMKSALHQDFFPTHDDLFTEMHFNHESKQASKFQIDPSSNCFTIDVSYFLILHKFCSVLTCNILGIGLL